jgi:hypothetical protein
LSITGVVADRENSYRGRVGGVHGRAITDEIAEHLRRGELLDLAPDLTLGSPVDEVVMTSWDGTHSITADYIRDLLRGRVVTDPDPRGLRLRAARIRGRLDLDNMDTTVKLTLFDCLLDGGITAEAAHLPGLSLRRCLLTHPSKSALYADALRTDAGVSFEGSTILTCTADGAIRINGAQIGGRLSCRGAPPSPTPRVSRCTVSASRSTTTSCCAGASPRSLRNARVRGRCPAWPAPANCRRTPPVAEG